MANATTYKIYGVFALLGIAACCFLLYQVKKVSDAEPDSVDGPSKGKKVEKIADFEPFPYDRRGKRACLSVERVSDASGSPLTHPVPLFWLRGTCVGYRKISRDSSDLAYEKCQIPRGDLESMLVAAKAKAGEHSIEKDHPLRLTLRMKDRPPVLTGLSTAELDALLGEFLKDATFRQAAPPIVSVWARPADAGIAGARWPFAPLSKRELATNGHVTSRRSDVNKRLRDKLKTPTAYTLVSGDEPGVFVVSAVARVDR